MKSQMAKRYGLYLLRWQLSTLILAPAIMYLPYSNITKTIIANLIGGLIFFWVDNFIFTSALLAPQWEIKDSINCCDCGIEAKGFRLIRTKNYDRTKDKNPQFRCEKCSEKKLEQLKEKGVQLD
jgi:hypothetical protein